MYHYFMYLANLLTKYTLLVFGGESKKEGVCGLELARGRVSKFCWWVAIRSRAWGLVSLIV